MTDVRPPPRPLSGCFVFFLLLAVSLGPATLVHAQAPVLHFEHFPEVSPWVFDLHQDREGFLWIGSGDGLYRYDGYRFRRYAHIPEDTTSLSGSNIKIIYEDRQGTLWIGTDRASGGAGLNRYERETDTFTRFVNNPNDPAGSSASAVRAILEDRGGALWVGTEDGGLYQFDRETETYAQYAYGPNDPKGRSGKGEVGKGIGSMPVDAEAAIYEDESGTLWVGSDAGLNRLDRETQTFIHFMHDPGDPTSIGRGVVTTMLEDGKGRFWVGTSAGGLCRMDRPQRTFSCYRHDSGNPMSLSDNRVTSIYEDAAGTLWVGTSVSTGEGGLNRFNPEIGTFDRLVHDPSRSTSLSNNNVESIFQDRSGVLWIGTFGGGLDKLKHPAPLFTAYLPPAKDLQAWTVLEDGSGRLWVSSGVGIHRLDRRTGQWTSFVHDPDDPKGLSQGIFRVLFEDRAGALWVGTGGGLDRFDAGTGTFEHFRHDPEDTTTPANSRIRSIYEDRQGRLWVGTWSEGGLNLMDRRTGRFTRFLNDPHDPASIGAGIVNSILEDSRGRFWVATSSGGLNLMDRETGRFTRFINDPTDPNSLSSNDVNPLLEHPSGMIWAGTFGSGLNLFDPESGRSRRFNTQNSCLPHDMVFGILQDEAGYLWLNTNHGIVRFDPEQETCTVFGLDDGLVSLASSPGSYKSARGEFFFGSFGGVHGFFPDEIPGSAAAPPVVLTDFRLFNRSVVPGPKSLLPRRITETEEIVLAHRQSSVGFEFAALHFTRPEQNRYAYQMEGFDADWIHSGNGRTATYTNLPPGAYVFRAKGANSDGVWNEDGTSVRLVILPPWWRTWWAYLFYGLLIAGCIFAADRVQRRRLIRKERDKTRQREVEQAREIEAANTRLRVHEQHLEEQNAMLQQQNTQIEAQAEQLRELDAVKARFFANISHEFRTPLTLLLGPIQDALKGGDRDQLEEHLPLMQRNAERLLSLIGQLLDLSKLEAGGMQLHARQTDLVPLLCQLALAFASRAERQGLTLIYYPEVETLPCFVDIDKLEKIVLNLLSNAFKFTDRGGKVRVHLARRHADTGAWAEIAVQDTGKGIPDAALPYMFGRFHQVVAGTTPSHEGTGIGLALTRELVELHQGTITVESTENFGSTFTVRLPLGQAHLQTGDLAEVIEPDAPDSLARRDVPADLFEGDGPAEYAAPAAVQEPEEHAEKDRPTVLVIEDNRDMRAYLKSHLAPRYRFAEAANGETGLELVRSLKPDLIISDVMMPLLDGLSLCRIVKSDPTLGRIPIVLLTARADEHSKMEGLATGADDYLAKPFNAEELLVRVENLIDFRRKLCAHFGGQVVVEPGRVVVTSAEAAFIERVRDIVEAQLGDTHFGVDELAAEVGLSARQLLRRMKETAGLTPNGYIRMLRLERAAQLLAQRAGSVSEIAYKVGFNQPDYFSKLFRQVFGVPPSEYASDP